MEGRSAVQHCLRILETSDPQTEYFSDYFVGIFVAPKKAILDETSEEFSVVFVVF